MSFKFKVQKTWFCGIWGFSPREFCGRAGTLLTLVQASHPNAQVGVCLQDETELERFSSISKDFGKIAERLEYLGVGHRLRVSDIQPGKPLMMVSLTWVEPETLAFYGRNGGKLEEHIIDEFTQIRFRSRIVWDQKPNKESLALA